MLVLLTTMSSDVRLKLEAATTLRDSLDHYTNGPIYPPFLKRLVPIFINILRGPCIFQSNSPEQVSYYQRIPPQNTYTGLRNSETVSSKSFIDYQHHRHPRSLSSHTPRRSSTSLCSLSGQTTKRMRHYASKSHPTSCAIKARCCKERCNNS